MRRRRLLATLAGATAAWTAGCGYAYGGGDVRDETTVRPFGLVRGEPIYDVGERTIVVARNGRQHDFETDQYRSATSVVVADRNGHELWRYTHWSESAAVAFGDGELYLLDEERRVVAVALVEREDDRGVEVSEPAERWRLEIPDAEPSLAADAEGVHVELPDGVAALRAGERAWRADVPGGVEELRPVDAGIAVRSSGAVGVVAADGEARWRYESPDVLAFDARGELLAVGDGDRLLVVDAADGRRRWSRRLDRRVRAVEATDDGIFALADGRVAAFDADGERAWTTAPSVAVTDAFVPAPEGVYDVDGRCDAVGVDSDGLRWRRELDAGGCEVADGWLDGETVAFLLESGDLVRLQRADQDPGLL